MTAEAPRTPQDRRGQWEAAQTANSSSWTPCPHCSSLGYSVHHGPRCDKAPQDVMQVIVGHFKAKGEYVGIVWEAIANGVLQALRWSEGSTVTIHPDGHVTSRSGSLIYTSTPATDEQVLAVAEAWRGGGVRQP